MNAVIDDLAVARVPQQDRSRQRFEKVIEEADKLLAETGLTGFSIPTLAERLGFTRRSIYMFFPTPYAVLNELTRRYIDKLQNHIIGIMPDLAGASLEELVVKVVFAAADFHNQNPVGRLLI
ncbi:MAG: TetR/AcrR family transcriptional regulator, partial [Salinisphaeraceae bacterium]|nr:TetR/AcrR family transcriptional regulator [Salinisphaeraceae bacterium]